MKKYIKPELIYENFELTHHIAGNCSVIMDKTIALDPLYCAGTAEEVPGAQGMKVFVTESVCIDFPVSDDYCYTVSDSLWVSHVS